MCYIIYLLMFFDIKIHQKATYCQDVIFYALHTNIRLRNNKISLCFTHDIIRNFFNLT